LHGGCCAGPPPTTPTSLALLNRLACPASQASQLTPALQAEFEAFHRFLTVRFFGAQTSPISDVTAAKYADHLR
jgi:hypothetical protein